MSCFRQTSAASLLAIALAVVASACGDDGPSSPAALPAPERSVFTQGEFDDIPVFRAATPVQGPTEKDGVITTSYETETAAPHTVISFYDRELPAFGWQPIEPVHDSGRRVWRGEWVRDGRRLEVTASPFVPTDDVTHTQFSVVVADDAAPIPAANSST